VYGILLGMEKISQTKTFMKRRERGQIERMGKRATDTKRKRFSSLPKGGGVVLRFEGGEVAGDVIRRSRGGTGKNLHSLQALTFGGKDVFPTGWGGKGKACSCARADARKTTRAGMKRKKRARKACGC